MAFPTLSTNPVSMEVMREKATISTNFEGGYEQTREKFNRIRKTFSVKYVVQQADRDLILAHYDDVKCSTIFDWTHPEDSTVHQVRYVNPPKVPISGAMPRWYEITLEMREA